MGVLTLSRELGSGGDAIAKQVAETLGWSLLDNDGFAAAARTYGYVRAELERVDERSPSFVDRFFRDRQLVYLDIMRAIVYESALKDNQVILGRGAYVLLRGIPGVLRARVVAPNEVRQRRLVQHEAVSPAMAEEFILHNDRERTSYSRYFFGTAWGEPMDFDIVLNTGYWEEDDATRILVDLLRKTSQVSPASSTKLQDLAFAQKVKAALMTDERLDAGGIAVDCTAPGRLRLHGRVNSEEEKDLAESIARSFAGVQALESELVVMPPIEGWYPV